MKTGELQTTEHRLRQPSAEQDDFQEEVPGGFGKSWKTLGKPWENAD